MPTAAVLRSKLLLDVRDFKEKLTDARKNFEETGKKLQSVGSNLSTRVTLPLVAIGGAAIKMASDAEEATNKFNEVFDESAGVMNAWVDEVQESIPASRRELQTMSADIGQLILALGGSGDQAVEFGQKFTVAAADLASFNNVPVPEALNAIRSALVGESEPLRRFGVDTRQAALEAKALELGLIAEGEALDQATRATVIMAQVQSQASDAMGDAARTADSTANQMKFLKANAEDLLASLGKELLPVFTDMVDGLNDIISSLDDANPLLKRAAVIAGGFFAVLGPSLWMLGSMARGITAIGTASQFAAPRVKALAGMTATLLGPLITLVGLYLTVQELTNNTAEENEKLANSFNTLAGPAGSVAASVEAATQQLTNFSNVTAGASSTADLFGNVVGGSSTAAVKSLEDQLKETIKEMENAGEASAGMKKKVADTIAALQEQVDTFGMNNVELLEYELRSNRATEADIRRAKALLKTIDAQQQAADDLEAITDALEENIKKRKEWLKQLPKIQKELDLEIARLEDDEQAVRRLEEELADLIQTERTRELVMEGASRAEADAIAQRERMIGVMERQREAADKWAAAHEKATERMEAALKDVADAAARFVGLFNRNLGESIDVVLDLGFAIHDWQKAVEEASAAGANAAAAMAEGAENAAELSGRAMEAMADSVIAKLNAMVAAANIAFFIIGKLGSSEQEGPTGLGFFGGFDNIDTKQVDKLLKFSRGAQDALEDLIGAGFDLENAWLVMAEAIIAAGEMGLQVGTEEFEEFIASFVEGIENDIQSMNLVNFEHILKLLREGGNELRVFQGLLAEGFAVGDVFRGFSEALDAAKKQGIEIGSDDFAAFLADFLTEWLKAFTETVPSPGAPDTPAFDIDVPTLDMSAFQFTPPGATPQRIELTSHIKLDGRVDLDGQAVGVLVGEEIVRQVYQELGVINK